MPRKINISQLAREHGLSPDTVHRRLNLGWPLEKALRPVLGPTNSKPITYRGKTQTLTDWAREYGVSLRTLSSRLERGWSMEQALAGKKNICKLAREHGISHSTLHNRLWNGWSLEDALATPARSYRRSKAK